MGTVVVIIFVGILLWFAKMYFEYTLNGYKWNLKSILVICAAVYFILQSVSEQKANLFLAIAAISFIPIMLIIRFVLRDFLYRTSIRSAKKRFVNGKNTLCNDNCMVKYFPDLKIVVNDNVNVKHDQYAFTVTKNDVKDINKCWNDICRMFDEYTYLQMLKTYFESFYCENNINPVLIKRYIPPEEAPQQNPQQTDEIAAYQNTQKININSATVQEISALPGLNLIMAKKVVDYRNKHGEFSNEEDFFRVAGVKDFFKSKIATIIDIKKVQTQIPDNQNNDNGRIVDF